MSDNSTLRFYTNNASRSKSGVNLSQGVQFKYAVWLPLRVLERPRSLACVRKVVAIPVHQVVGAGGEVGAQLRYYRVYVGYKVFARVDRAECYRFREMKAFHIIITGCRSREFLN